MTYTILCGTMLDISLHGDNAAEAVLEKINLMKIPSPVPSMSN